MGTSRRQPTFRRIVLATFIMSGVLTFLTPGFSESSEPALVTLRGDLPPVRATYNDLVLLSRDIQTILERSSAPSREQGKRAEKALRFQVGSRDAGLTSRSLEALIAEDHLPDPAGTFRISTSGYGSREDSIRDIQISFQDRFSYYELIGTDLLVLQPIKTRIEGFAEAHRNRLGGPGIVMGMFGLITLTSLLMVSLSPAGQTLSPNILLGIRIAGMMLLIAAFYSLFFDRFFELFPTTAIYGGAASVFVRYGPEFMFWGFVIGLIALIATMILTRRPREQSPEQ